MNTEDEDLKGACFEMARVTMWEQKPVDTAAIAAVADKFYHIAKGQVSEPLGIDYPLLTRAVKYLANAHAIPPMNDGTQWFYEMLRVVVEIARPNTGINDENKEFLQDMLEGIGRSLRG